MNRNAFFKIAGSLFFILSLPVGVILVQQAVKYFSSAGGTPANLSIDMSKDFGQVTDTWRNLAQGGEDGGRQLSSVISQTKSLQPQYIRIDHVFDFYNPEGDNFQKFDQIISDITSTGAKPFIALSYTPSNLAQNGDVTSIPSDWRAWENLVQKTVEHVSGRGGLAINNVYYEVWNEPDIFGKFKMGGSKSYLDLYLHTAVGANRAGNILPYKLGGPATSGYIDSWMSGLTNFASRNGLKLDFLSWHRYDKKLDDYIGDLTKVGVYGKENILSEMGPNGSNDPAYDNYFGAIHELAVATVMQNFGAKSFTFEIKDGANSDKKYWGRWGLYTNEKFGAPEAKPRANAVLFLNRMIGGNGLSVLGQGSWVRAMAKKYGDNLTKILVVNYDPAGSHAEIVPITLTGLKSQNFTLKRTDFLGSTSSQDVATTSAEWSTNQYFKPNSAAIFEVTSR